MPSLWRYTVLLMIVLYYRFTLAIECQLNTEYENACKFGRMSLKLQRKTEIKNNDCDSIINNSQLTSPPLVSIIWPNKSELFTIMMLDAGQYNKGPYFLHWLVTNVTADQLKKETFSNKNILTRYQAPSQENDHYYQFLGFRQYYKLHIEEEDYKYFKNSFNIKNWIKDAKIKLCGPVAGLQIRSKSDITSEKVIPNKDPDELELQPNKTMHKITENHEQSSTKLPSKYKNGTPLNSVIHSNESIYYNHTTKMQSVPNLYPTEDEGKEHGEEPTNCNNESALRPKVFFVFIVFVITTCYIRYIFLT